MRLSLGLLFLMACTFIPFLAHEIDAFEVSSYEVSLELEYGGLHEHIAIEFLNTKDFPIEHFSYAFQGELQNLRVYDEAGELETEVERDEGVTLSSRFRAPLGPNESYTINIEFDTSGYGTSYPDFREFSMVLYLPKNTRSFGLKLKLPEGAVLPRPIREPLTTSDVVPLPDRVYSDGRSIIFEWREEGIEDFSVYVKYLPEERPFQTPLPLVLSLAILVLLGLALYLWRKKELEKIEYLKEDEQLIIREIMGEEGIDQRKIQQKTGFSKAKVSKIVSELEKRDIVRKERIGRRNKLYLTEEFKKS